MSNQMNMYRPLVFILGLLLLTQLGAVRASVRAGTTVRIDNLQFQPNVVEVKAGETVTWNNADNRDHTVNAADGSFRSGNIPPGGAYSFTFSKAGTYRYGSRYYPRMQGTVNVK